MSFQQTAVTSGWEDTIRVTTQSHLSKADLTPLQHKNAPNSLPPSTSVPDIAPEQQLIKNAERKIESLEMKLSEYAMIIQATRTDLHNCQKARHEETAACNSALILEQRKYRECTQAYHSMCQQNQRMVSDLHHLAASKLRLQQELGSLRRNNQVVQNEPSSIESPSERGLADAARVNTPQIKVAEPETQEFNLAQTQAEAPSPNPLDKDATTLLTEEERLTSQTPIQNKRPIDDDNKESEEERRPAKRARRTRQSK